MCYDIPRMPHLNLSHLQEKCMYKVLRSKTLANQYIKENVCLLKAIRKKNASPVLELLKRKSFTSRILPFLFVINFPLKFS